MAKTKKKPTGKSKTPVKKAKPAKSDKKKMVAKTAKKAEASKKAAPKGKGAVKAAAKPVKAAKPTKEELKKLAKEAKEAAKLAAQKSKEKKKREEEEFEDIELGPIESYGDAIRLTPQDLEEPDDIFLTDAEGRRYCKMKDCDQLALVEGFCRFHYLALWKKIQIRKKILTDGKLEKYIEELTSRYPDKYIEMIRRDLKTEKDFLTAIQELEIDDSAENDMEEDSNFIDEVRGISTPRGTGEGGGQGEEF